MPLPFYTVLKRYMLFWLFSSCDSNPLSGLKLLPVSNVELSGVAYAPLSITIDTLLMVGFGAIIPTVITVLYYTTEGTLTYFIPTPIAFWDLGKGEKMRRGNPFAPPGPMKPLTRNGLMILVLAIVILLAPQATLAEDDPKDAEGFIELEVLAFGTSNVEGGRRYISEIADATGKYRIEHAQWFLNPMKPALGLEGLWNAIQENETNPTNNDGSVKQGGKSVREQLESKQWDAIVLASHELTSNAFITAVSDEKRRAEYEALPKCLEYIKKHAPQARLFYYNTYANGPSYDEFDHPYVRSYIESVEKRRGKPIDRPFELFIQDAEADIQRCQDVCKEFSLHMIPVRQALWLAHVDPEWGYIFTPTDKEDILEPPHLPANYFRPSLHIGPIWVMGENGKPSLENDPHINMAGSYIVGCLVVQALTGEAMIGNTFVPKEKVVPWDGKDGRDKSDTFDTLSTDECAILQRIAAKAMRMKDDPPKMFIREYIRMREEKLKYKEKGIYKCIAPN